MTWDTIASLQKSVMVRSLSVWFVIIPLLAKFLSSPSAPAVLTSIELPFTWGVFYAASFVFFCSTIFYAVFCPKLVKRYEAWRDFANLEGSYEKLIPLIERIMRWSTRHERTLYTAKLISNGWVRFHDESGVTQIYRPEDVNELAKQIRKRIVYTSIADPAVLIHVFALTWQVAQRTMRPIRYLITLLQVAGIILLGYILWENVMAVARYYQIGVSN